ncbi:hypothetical protein [Spirochaeta isovalerica]|uniref:Uncharacterized protein n=1 Tax=Spirochaeta isovalerica TaxID=150 RepID=A0A841RF75_9SPIO|nr:hypothetical protein [Spirochaeta isovalerica]MBB6482256.1 hypothetical protein [Spirochaeta isovalerica]
MINSLTVLPLFLVIGSQARNSGKTSFSRKIIRTFGPELIVVKITVISRGHSCPHGDRGCGVCSSLQTPFDITEETDRESGKDTSQLLQAGARRVFWLRVRNDAVARGLRALLKRLDPGIPVLCESNSIVKYIQPGLYIQLKARNRKNTKKSAKELVDRTDLIVETTPDGADFDFSRLSCSEEGWSIKKT